MTPHKERLIGFAYAVLNHDECPDPSAVLFKFSAEENKWQVEVQYNQIMHLSEALPEEEVYTEEDFANIEEALEEDGRESDSASE